MNSKEKKLTLIGVVIVAITAFAVYHPAFKIQFYDGWWYLIWSATMDLPRYLVQFFDPANITQGYRPVQGLYMYLLYHLFGFNPDGYHFAHNLLHAANAALVFLLVARLSNRTRLAFIAAIIYATLPNYTLAIFWHAVVDPLAGFFYLLTLLLWARFLETKHAHDYAITFIVFLFALLSKEIAVFLPFFMFLVQWWFIGEKPNARRDLRRYAPFLLAFIPYLYQVYQVQSRGEFVGQFGFRLGPHMLNNLIPYLAILTFPWQVDLPTDSIYFIWLSIVIVVYAGVMIIKRSAPMLFLALFAGLNIAPLLGFPLDYFHARYLYLSTISSAVILALIFEWLWQFVSSRRWLSGLVAFGIACLVVFNSSRVADAAAGLAEYTRQVRVPFRDISREHPTFPPGTYVYFVHSPLTSYWDFEGLFFSKYGNNVKVNSTDLGHPVNLRNYSNAYVYYFDATGKPIEIPVDPQIDTHITPPLAAQFEIPVVLNQAETPTAQLERGKALIVMLHWQATAKLESDYTVFAHLVDAHGNLISAYDSPPGRGKSPTTQWLPGRSVVDAIVVPIPADTPLGEHYRLELGLYDSATMQRFAVTDTTGKRIDDKIMIEPFRIVK